MMCLGTLGLVLLGIGLMVAFDSIRIGFGFDLDFTLTGLCLRGGQRGVFTKLWLPSFGEMRSNSRVHRFPCSELEKGCRIDWRLISPLRGFVRFRDSTLRNAPTKGPEKIPGQERLS